MLKKPEKIIINDVTNSFSTSYVMSFDEIGQHKISISVSLLDENEREWKTFSSTNAIILVNPEEIIQRLTFL